MTPIETAAAKIFTDGDEPCNPSLKAVVCLVHQFADPLQAALAESRRQCENQNVYPLNARIDVFEDENNRLKIEIQQRKDDFKNAINEQRFLTSKINELKEERFALKREVERLEANLVAYKEELEASMDDRSASAVIEGRPPKIVIYKCPQCGKRLVRDEGKPDLICYVCAHPKQPTATPKIC